MKCKQKGHLHINGENSVGISKAHDVRGRGKFYTQKAINIYTDKICKIW